MLSNLLTNSRMKVARACAREHQIRYELGYRTIATSDALRFGSLIHIGLEAWWKNRWSADRLNLTLAALAGEADPYDRARAEVLLVGYEMRWSEVRLDPIAVEVEFSAPMVNPATGHWSKTWQIAGKLDVLARDLDTERTVIVEHKTSSEDVSPGSTYWKRLRMDSQVSIYFDGAEALGHPADACVYDVIAKPGIRPARATPPESRKYTKDGRLYAAQRDTDESPEEFRERLAELVSASPDKYFARGEVVRLENELADARFDVWSIGRQIRDNELANRHPRNPDACLRYGRECAFFDVCTGAGSLDDTFKFVRSDCPHAELSQVAPKEEAAQ